MEISNGIKLKYGLPVRLTTSHKIALSHTTIIML